MDIDKFTGGEALASRLPNEEPEGRGRQHPRRRQWTGSRLRSLPSPVVESAEVKRKTSFTQSLILVKLAPRAQGEGDCLHQRSLPDLVVEPAEVKVDSLPAWAGPPVWSTRL